MEKETMNWYCQIPWHVWYIWYCVCFLLYPICSHLCFLWETIVTKLSFLSSGYFRNTSRLYDESSSFSLGILFVFCRNQTAPLSVSYCFPKIAYSQGQKLQPLKSLFYSWNVFNSHWKMVMHFVLGRCQSLLILFCTLQWEKPVYQEIVHQFSK